MIISPVPKTDAKSAAIANDAAEPTTTDDTVVAATPGTESAFDIEAAAIAASIAVPVEAAAFTEPDTTARVLFNEHSKKKKRPATAEPSPIKKIVKNPNPIGFSAKKAADAIIRMRKRNVDAIMKEMDWEDDEDEPFVNSDGEAVDSRREVCLFSINNNNLYPIYNNLYNLYLQYNII